MKTLIGIVAILLFMIFALILNTSSMSKSVRTDETYDASVFASKDTVKETAIKNIYKIQNNDQAVADFLKNLSKRLDSNSIATVRILKIDKEKGVIDVEVTEKFNYTNGKSKEVDKRSTIIAEEYPRD